MERAVLASGKREKFFASRRRRRTLRDVGIGVGVAVVACAALFVVWRYYIGENKVDITRDYTYPSGGYVYQYAAPGYVDLKDELRMLVSDDTRVPVVGGKPLYFSSNDLMTLADMAAIDYNAGQSLLLPVYSVAYSAGGKVMAEWDGDPHRVPAQLLHDGGDAYVFLSPVTVELEGAVYELSAMSYAIAIYGRSVELYNAETGFCTVLRSDGEAIATFEDGASINLSLDILTQPNGMQQILMPNPLVFPEIP